MRDADSASLKITDTDPEVFEQLLRWMYIDEVDEAAMAAFGERLLMGANRYELAGLKQLCEAKLCTSLTGENAAARLVLAEQMEADQLKETVLAFIGSNAQQVMNSEGWADLQAYNGGSLMTEVLAFAMGAKIGGAGDKGKKRTADEAGLSAQDEEVEAMREWKVARLREALQERGLDTKGRKPELMERLENAIRGKAGAGESSGSASASGLGSAQ